MGVKSRENRRRPGREGGSAARVPRGAEIALERITDSLWLAGTADTVLLGTGPAPAGATPGALRGGATDAARRTLRWRGTSFGRLSFFRSGRSVCGV